MDLIANGKAPKIVQPAEGATYDAYITAKPELAEIDWATVGRKAETLHNFIRGCDKVPGAWTTIDGQKVIMYGSTLWEGPAKPEGEQIILEKHVHPAIVHANGMLLMAADGHQVKEVMGRRNIVGAEGRNRAPERRNLRVAQCRVPVDGNLRLPEGSKTQISEFQVNVRQLQLADGRMIPASKFGKNGFEDRVDLELSEDEKTLEKEIHVSWGLGRLGRGLGGIWEPRVPMAQAGRPDREGLQVRCTLL